MSAYPYLVQTAYNVINAVLAEWQEQPYRWLKERDLQAEISGRLSQIFNLQGKGTLQGKHRWIESEQTWSRVSCEPYVGYVYYSKRSRCYPDIVIWKDIDSKKQPTDETSTGWPILWACELKYGSSNKGEWDREKLRLLLEQDKIEYGCSINIHFEKSSTSITLSWEKELVKGKQPNRLWVCDITLPKTSSGAQ